MAITKNTMLLAASFTEPQKEGCTGAGFLLAENLSKKSFKVTHCNFDRIAATNNQILEEDCGRV